MRTLGKQFYALFPTWAHPTHPVMRAVIAPRERVRQRARIARRVLTVGVIIGLLLLNLGWHFLIMLGHGLNDSGIPIYWSDWTISDSWIFILVYLPWWGMQLLAQTGALLWGANVMAHRQEEAWHVVQSTEDGIRLVMLAQWAAVFHRFRLMLTVIMLGRLLLIVALLIQLTGYHGHHLALYLSEIQPEISPVVGLILLTVLVLAAWLLPLVIFGFNAALGLALSTSSRTGFSPAKMKGMVLFIEVVVFNIAVSLGWNLIMKNTERVLDNGAPPLGIHAWIAALAMSVLGDQGLSLMSLQRTLRLWDNLAYGPWVGPVLLVVVALLALLIYSLLRWTMVRAGGTPGRRYNVAVVMRGLRLPLIAGLIIFVLLSSVYALSQEQAETSFATLSADGCWMGMCLAEMNTQEKVAALQAHPAIVAKSIEVMNGDTINFDLKKGGWFSRCRVTLESGSPGHYSLDFYRCSALDVKLRLGDIVSQLGPPHWVVTRDWEDANLYYSSGIKLFVDTKSGQEEISSLIVPESVVSTVEIGVNISDPHAGTSVPWNGFGLYLHPH